MSEITEKLRYTAARLFIINDNDVAKIMRDAAERIEKQETASANYVLEIEKLADENRVLRERHRWVPLSERLPEIGDAIWLCDTSNTIWEDTWRALWTSHPEIKAWMRRQTKPLPPPPQEQG